jgi:hypothetical protein
MGDLVNELFERLEDVRRGGPDSARRKRIDRGKLLSM